jgi:hypothetical protein
VNEAAQHTSRTQDKEAEDARAMWRTAPKELAEDHNDEFDEYFKGMFP